jgi:hypothetical protein
MSNQQLSSAFSNLNESFNSLNQSFLNLNQKYNELAGLSASTTNESLGLTFNMAINTTLLQSGEAISITLNETNALPHFNNITASDNWLYSGFPEQICSDSPSFRNLPFALAIVHGYYSKPDLNGTTSLLILYPLGLPGTVFCVFTGGPPSEYDFYPSSNVAIARNATFDHDLNESISTSMSFSGYYNSSQWFSTETINFPPGVYTVIGGDEWGQLVLLHFVVQGSGTTTGYLWGDIVGPQWNSSLGTSLGNLYNDIQGPVSTLSYQGNLSLGTGPDLYIQGPVQIFDPPITYTFNNQTDGRLPDNYRGLYFGNDLFGMPNPPQGNSSSGTPLGKVK